MNSSLDEDMVFTIVDDEADGDAPVERTPEDDQDDTDGGAPNDD